jgi:hypothetical protein
LFSLTCIFNIVEHLLQQQDTAGAAAAAAVMVTRWMIS